MEQLLGAVHELRAEAGTGLGRDSLNRPLGPYNEMGVLPGGPAAQRLVGQYRLGRRVDSHPQLARAHEKSAIPMIAAWWTPPRRRRRVRPRGNMELNGRLSDALTSLARERVARVAAEATDVGDVYTAYQADRASLTQALKTVQVSDAPYLPALAHAPLGP